MQHAHWDPTPTQRNKKRRCGEPFDAVVDPRRAVGYRVLCTHPVLSGSAYENIEKSKIEEVIVCDTLPLKKDSSKIKVLSTAKLFARATRNMHEHRSISALFVEK